MIQLHFTSYGGTHKINESLLLVPSDPSVGSPAIILRDKVGYYGFMVEREQLSQLCSWLLTVLQHPEKKST